MLGIFAGKEKGGVSIEKAGELLMLADLENGTNFFDQQDPNAGRNAIIEVLSKARTKGDLNRFITTRREEMARREREEELNEYARWCYENFDMSVEDYEAYVEVMERQARALTDEAVSYISGEIYDDIIGEIEDREEVYSKFENKNDNRDGRIERDDEGGDPGVDEGGDSVLQGEQPVQVERATGVAERHEEADSGVGGTYGAAQEGAPEGIKPIGKGFFGNIYDQFKGKVKEAFDFLVNHKEGDLLGVFHRDGIGSIDLVWGNDNGGLKHIIKRHIEEQNDFSDVSEIQSAIIDAISNGDIVRENEDKIVLQTDRYKVSINKQYRDENGNVIERKNWIVTAFDKTKGKGEKKNTPSRETLTTPSSSLNKADGVTLPSNGGISTSKGSISSSGNQANEQKVSIEKNDDTVGGSPVTLEYLLEGGQGSIENAGYFLHGVAAAFPSVTDAIEAIRQTMLQDERLGESPLDFVLHDYPEIENIRSVINNVYGAKGVELYNKLLANASGFVPREGKVVGRQLEELTPIDKSKVDADVYDSEGESISDRIKEAEANTNINPTEAQKEAGNYKKGHVQVGTFDITIEKPKGSVRSGVDANGNRWETTMRNTYGYIRGTEGVDGEHIDVFLSNDVDGWNGRRVFVVDQYNEDGSFDEHKVMLGFNEQEDAEAAYFANYDKDWAKKHKTVVTAVSLEDFEKWIASSHRKTKAFAEYKGVKADVAQKEQGVDKIVREQFDSYKKGDKFIDDGPFGSGKVLTLSEFTGSENNPTAILYDDKGNIYKELYSNIGTLLLPINENKKNTRKKSVKAIEGTEEDVREQRADGEQQSVSAAESALRDALIDKLRESGLEVVTDSEAAQRVLDEANGIIKLSAKQKRALETASLSQREKDQPTVVSSADGAKILKNLDNLFNELEKKSNYPKTFIGELAESIGAETKGSSSQYATFETINGQIVTIRLANHNASTKRMDDAGRYNAISIVISSKPNEGILNDGNAHVVEFYYDSIKLRRADGHPLAEIVRSIKQALYSGEYKDTTGLAEVKDVNSPRFFRTANGEAYGFTVDGKIYLDPKIAMAETPIHEYTHLWADALRAQNPQEWQNVVGLMKDAPLWDGIKNLYPELKTDDEIADEVLAHYSGRRGSERLREEQRRIAKGDGSILDKANAIAAIQNVRDAVAKFWKGVADWLGIHFTTAEDVADKVLADLLNGVNPMAADGKGRSLAGIHNISEEKFGKALKMGGLANPSVAVMDMAQGSHEGYGEISLITPSALIDKKTGGNAGTFSGDAWTPTYPQVERQFSEDGSSKVDNDLSKLPNEVRSVVRRAWNSYMDGRDADGLAYQFLHEKGMAPEMREMHTIYSEKIHQMIEASEVLEGDAREQAILDAYIESRFEGSREKFNDYIATRKRVLEKKIAESPVKKGIAFEGMNDSLAEINERGYEARPLYRFASEVKADLRRKGTIDADGTVRDAINQVRESNELGKEYKKWRNALDERYGIKEVLFNGYTPDGRRKYLPHTLENVSKLMKKEGLAAATGWSGSFSKFAAGLMKNVGTLTAIRKQKERLTPDHGKVEAFRKKWEDVYFNLGLKLNPDGGAFDDTGLYRLEEVVTKSNPKAFAKKEYGVEIEDKDVQQMKDMVRAIREEYPAMYFETKFERPVGLDEFVAAVVPMDALEETKEALRNAGLKLFEYDSNKTGDRRRALTEAVQAKGVRFQLVGEKGAANMDKAEEATTRLDNLAVAREMEQSFEEKKQRIEKLRKSEPVEITGNEYEGKYELNRESAQKYILQNLRDEYTIADTGELVKVTKKGAKKVTSHSMGNEVHLKSIAVIPEIIKMAVFIEETPAYKNDAQYDSYRYYVTGLKVAGEDYTVRMTIGVKNGEFYYDHYLTDIEKGNLIEAARSFKPTEDAPNPSYAAIKDTKLLSILQTNEQENARKIKLATGWERGADGKWRYEVMDGEVRENPKVEQKETSDGEIYYTTTLGEILQNKSLYEAYPQLKDLPIVIQEMDGFTLGSYQPATSGYPNGYMILNMGTYRHQEKAENVQKKIKQIEETPEYKEYSKYFDEEIPESYKGRESEWEAQMDEAERKFFASDLGKMYYELMWKNNRYQTVYGFNESGKSVLVHEVQHAIQDIEGFARGGNESTYRAHLAGLKEKHDAWSVIEEFEDKSKELGDDARPIDVYNALVREYESLGVEFGDGIAPSREAFDKGFNLWVRGYDNEGYEDTYNEYQRLAGKFGLGGGNNRYDQLAGEVEARNVQSRMDMTEEERRKTLAAETEDVAREDQLFIMENAGKALSSDATSVEGVKKDEGLRFREDDLEEVNERFNERLLSLKENPNQKNRVLSLGVAGPSLQKGGLANAEILLEYDKIVKKSNDAYKNKHPFDVDDIKDLPLYIHEPIAVFNNTNGNDTGIVILIELKKDGRNFIVAVRAEQKKRKGGLILEVNQITTLFPKEARGIIHWINQDKAKYIDKDKALRFIEALQNHPGTKINNEELSSATKVVKEFENPSVEDGNLHRKTSDYGYLDSENDSSVQKLSSEAERIASSLNAPIRIIHDVNEITDEDEQRQARMRGSKGWYDTNTGEVVVVLPNATNIGDVQATMMHEIVAHKGLRGLLGARLNDMLDLVFKSVPADIRKRVAKEAVTRHDGDTRVATEEYLASIAERGVNTYVRTRLHVRSHCFTHTFA